MQRLLLLFLFSIFSIEALADRYGLYEPEYDYDGSSVGSGDFPFLWFFVGICALIVIGYIWNKSRDSGDESSVFLNAATGYNVVAIVGIGLAIIVWVFQNPWWIVGIIAFWLWTKR